MFSIKEKPEIFRKAYEITNINLVPKKYYKDTTINKKVVRIFNENGTNIIIYLHGGGFVLGSINTHSNICYKISNYLDAKVISIDYSLAPERKFPYQLQEITSICKDILKTNKDVSIMGDSAGANLAFSVNLLLKNKFKNIIMIYPCTQTDYTSKTKFKSVIKNSAKSALTKESLRDYMSLYLKTKKDYNNKYVNLLKNNWLFNYPTTIIVTGTSDPLHDEGIALKQKLERYNVKVYSLDLDGAKHGFFTNNIDTKYTDETLKFIKKHL